MKSMIDEIMKNATINDISIGCSGDSVKEIVNVLKKANYPEFHNDIGYSYLFQIFVGDKELLEFDYGSIYASDDSISIIFTENDKNLLNNYIY